MGNAILDKIRYDVEIRTEGPLFVTKQYLKELFEDLETSGSGLGGGLQIPKLILRSSVDGHSPNTTFAYYCSKVDCSFYPISDSSFLKYNPQIWFFKLRRRNMVPVKQDGVIIDRREVGNKWVHPPDINGVPIWAPSQNSYIYQGNTSRPLHTEFPLTITQAYQWQNIPFNPFEYYSKTTPEGSFISPLDFTDFPLGVNEVKASGVDGGKKRRTKVVQGYFAIAIDNPNATSGKAEKMFGPPSDLFQIIPQLNTDQINGGAVYKKIFKLQINLNQTTLRRRMPTI